MDSAFLSIHSKACRCASIAGLIAVATMSASVLQMARASARKLAPVTLSCFGTWLRVQPIAIPSRQGWRGNIGLNQAAGTGNLQSNSLSMAVANSK